MDRPIPFSGPMIRALRAGTKTQTRRVIEPIKGNYRAGDIMATWPSPVAGVRDGTHFRPRFAVGDRLWVREAWRTEARFDDLPPRDVPVGSLISYEADYDDEPNDGCRGRYRHGRFMCRWMSRATLTVTGVKVERLQDISEADALAEGVDPLHSELASYHYTQRNGEHTELEVRTLKPAYRRIWEAINGPGSWDMNPFVVAPAFTVELANIDSLGATP